jgi:GntR family transcriptional regulator
VVPDRPQIFRQIYNDLRQAIEDGQYPPGTPLPSYAELRERYVTADPTLSRAVDLLQADGLVVGIRGKGVIVRDRVNRRRVVRGRRVRRDPARGYIMPATQRADEPWQTHGRPRVATIPCPPRVADILGIPAWTDAVRRRRVTSPAGEAPFQIADTWISPQGVADAPRCAQPDTGPGGYLDRLEEAGHGPISWVETFRVRMPDREEARLLGIATALPVLELARPGTSAKTNRPVEVTMCVIPSDRVEIVTELERDESARWPTTPPTGRY